jgi:hypothetical protein
MCGCLGKSFFPLDSWFPMSAMLTHGACVRAVILKRIWWGYTGDWEFHGFDKETSDEATSDEAIRKIHISISLPSRTPTSLPLFRGHQSKAKDLISASPPPKEPSIRFNEQASPLPLPLGQSVRVCLCCSLKGAGGGRRCCRDCCRFGGAAVVVGFLSPLPSRHWRWDFTPSWGGQRLIFQGGGGYHGGC